ncbi:hypothetical protein ACJ72_05956, partial [Emergomyces africanus]
MAALVHQLSIGKAFNDLHVEEKLYAHHLARAAWHGTRIILRQVSPESNDIFDFILALHALCQGEWHQLANRASVSTGELDKFLAYAATFLSNIGNYYGSGNQKFTPNIPQESLAKLGSLSKGISQLYDKIKEPLFSATPACLGFPSDNTQSAYYLRDDDFLSREEISRVSQRLEPHIFPENTRIRKTRESNGSVVYEILQASICRDTATNVADVFFLETGEKIKLVRGDHSPELSKVCRALTEAAKYAANPQQQNILRKYVESFTSGDLQEYRESQRLWVKDINPKIENIFGFVEPYRDPLGIRAEFEGLVAISDAVETRSLTKLANESSTFIQRLPWADGYDDNDGKGPFEKEIFETPGFTSIH